MLITRVRISWYMGGFMALWAVVSTLTALAKDFKGLLLTRFFLGITEAPYYPGALYMLSIFYTRKEIATRISILYTGNILATAFAGLIALGIFQMGGMAGLSGWRWLFIIQGLVTFVVALASLFVLPDDPTRTWWLTPEERKLAQERMDRDTVGNQGQSSTLQGLKEAVTDIVSHPLAPYHAAPTDRRHNSASGSSYSPNTCISPPTASRTFFRRLCRRWASTERSRSC